MTRGNEISKQLLLLFRDCVFSQQSVLEMWLRLLWCRFPDARAAARHGSEILLTDCDSLLLAVWLQVNGGAAQMGMLFSMHAGWTDWENSKLGFFWCSEDYCQQEHDIAIHIANVGRLGFFNQCPDINLFIDRKKNHPTGKYCYSAVPDWCYHMIYQLFILVK